MDDVDDGASGDDDICKCCVAAATTTTVDDMSMASAGEWMALMRSGWAADGTTGAANSVALATGGRFSLLARSQDDGTMGVRCLFGRRICTSSTTAPAADADC